MKKTNKIISSLLVLAMVLSTLVGVIVPTAAEPVTLSDDETGTVDTTGCTAVSTADQFFAMENGGKYYLANDIDLRGRKDFTNVGWPTTYEAHKIVKDLVLEGNNKTLTIDSSIFNILQNVEIRNLTIDGTLRYINGEDLPYQQSPLSSGTYNANVAGTNPGKVTLKYVKSSVDIVAVQTYHYKHIAGVIYETGAGSVLDHVSFDGTITTYDPATETKDTATRQTRFEAVSGIVGVVAGATSFTSCSASGSIIASKNLSIKDDRNEVLTSGIAAIASKVNAGGTTFTNCTNNMTIESYTTVEGIPVGGIVGLVKASTTFNNCINNGTVTAMTKAGGIVGDATAETTFTNCQNNGDVSAKWAGGMIGYSSVGTVAADGCVNTGDITATVDSGAIGGIAGAPYALVDIQNCSNSGHISMATNTSAVSMGGIVGRVGNDLGDAPTVTTGTFIIKNCTNTGDLTSHRPSTSGSGTGTGGILGLAWVNAPALSSISLAIEGCRNSGNIGTHSALAATTAVEQRGGIVGYSAMVKNVTIKNCINDGDIYAPYDNTAWNMGMGGIYGTHRCFGEYSNGNNIPASYPSSLLIENCINNGDITGIRVAGIFANTNEAGGNSTFVFKNCVNNGKIKGSNDASGIINFTERGSSSTGPTVALTACVNAGEISGLQTAAGMIGTDALSTTTLTRCVNSGKVTSMGEVGGMVAKRTVGTQAITFDSCVNTGELSGWTTAAMISTTSSDVVATNCVNKGQIADVGGTGGVIIDTDNGHTVTVTNCQYLTGTIDAAYSNGATASDTYAIESAMGGIALPAYDLADIKANYAFATSIKNPAKLYGSNEAAFTAAKTAAKECLDSVATLSQSEVDAINVALYNALWNYTDTTTYEATIPETLPTGSAVEVGLITSDITELSRIRLVVDSSFTLRNEHGDTINYKLVIDEQDVTEKTVLVESVGVDVEKSVSMQAVLLDADNKTPGTYYGAISFALIYNNGKYDINADDSDLEEGDDDVTEVPEISKEAFDDSAAELVAVLPKTEDPTYFYQKNIDIGQGSLMHISKCAGVDEYKQYLYDLQEAGFSYYTENEIGDNLYTTFATKTQIVNAMYIEAFGELRVIVDKRRQGTYNETLTIDGYKDYFAGFDLPGLDPNTQFTTDQLKQSAFVCVTGEFYDWVGKLGYIFKLADGSFFIIDGGYTDLSVIKDPNNTTSQEAAKYIMDVLEKYADDPNNIRLSWYVTHWHEDHVGALIEFSRNQAYVNRVTMDSFIYNMVDVEGSKFVDSGQQFYYECINTIINNFKPEKVIKAHPGQTLYLANLEIDVYTTHELLYYSPLSTLTNVITKGNNFSLTSRFSFMGKEMLFTGDSSFEMNPFVLGPCYGNALGDIDVLQVPHHGYADTNAISFTRYMNNVSIVLWPVDARHFYGGRIGYEVTASNPNGYGGVVDIAYYSHYMGNSGVKHYVHCVYDDIYFEFDGDESTWWTPEPVSDPLQIFDPTAWVDHKDTSYWSQYNSVYMKDKQ